MELLRSTPTTCAGWMRVVTYSMRSTRRYGRAEARRDDQARVAVELRGGGGVRAARGDSGSGAAGYRMVERQRESGGSASGGAGGDSPGGGGARAIQPPRFPGVP